MQPVKSKVTLVGGTPDPQEVIASAAKLCYAADVSTVTSPSKEEAGQFVRKLLKLGHMSPLEHASFTFYVEGVSRAMTHQLVRHRVASYSQRSQRYVSHSTFDYIVPPQIEGKTVEADGRSVDAVEYFRETMELIAERYRRLSEAMGDLGERSNEDARYVLPNACETKIFVTMNTRELLHFFEERLCMRAQWEIRGVAEQMLEAVGPVFEEVFENAGPKCVRLGHCPEGKMTCGKFREMVKKYRKGQTDEGDGDS